MHYSVEKGPEDVEDAMKYNQVQAQGPLDTFVSIEPQRVDDGNNARETESNKHGRPVGSPLRCAEVLEPGHDATSESQEAYLSEDGYRANTHERRPGTITHGKQVYRHPARETKQPVIQSRHIAAHNQEYYPRVV